LLRLGEYHSSPLPILFLAGGPHTDSNSSDRWASGRVAPVPVRFSTHAEGAPGPSQLGTGDGSASLHKPAPGWSILAVYERRAHPLSANGGVPLPHLQQFPPRTYLSSGAAMELFEDALEL
jgi:hypothetical protein